MLQWRMQLLWLFGWVIFSMTGYIECIESRMCYFGGPKCDHILQCNETSRIGILSAYYKYINRTSYRECSCGSVQCDNGRGDSTAAHATQCHRGYKDEEYWNLVSRCSFRRNCSVPLPPQQNHTCMNSTSSLQASFSLINYWCIPDNTVVDFCNGTKSGTRFSILYDQTSRTNHCSCTVKGLGREDNTTTYIMRVLDIQNASLERVGNVSFSFVSGDSTKRSVNRNLGPNKRMYNFSGHSEFSVKLVLSKVTEHPSRVWLTVGRGRDNLNITCRSEDDQNMSGYPRVTATSTAYSNNLSHHPTYWTKATQSTIEKPMQPFIEAGPQITTIAGGVVGGLVVTAAILAILAIYCIKRNKSTENNHESKRSHTNHMYNVTENDNIYSVAVIGDAGKEVDVQGSNNVVYGHQTNEPTYFQLEAQANTNAAASTVEAYDHLKLDAHIISTQRSQGIYDHMKENAEDCYNHLGTDTKQRTKLTPDYDTTASATRAVQKMENKDDYYSYDHLGRSTGMTVGDNDYDTMVQGATKTNNNT